jgi:hypothetical protein
MGSCFSVRIPPPLSYLLCLNPPLNCRAWSRNRYCGLAAPSSQLVCDRTSFPESGPNFELNKGYRFLLTLDP